VLVLPNLRAAAIRLYVGSIMSALIQSLFLDHDLILISSPPSPPPWRRG
jgi:hypothetical protein